MKIENLPPDLTGKNVRIKFLAPWEGTEKEGKIIKVDREKRTITIRHVTAEVTYKVDDIESLEEI